MQTRVEIADFENWRRAAKEAAKELDAGGIVAVPTETVYGLAADAFNAEAVAKVFEAKERPTFDPLIVHLSRFGELDRVAEVPEEIAEVVREIATKFWPGPLTMVLPKTAAVPDIVTSGLSTVAVRISKHEVIRTIAKELGRPLAAPSANRFGRVSPTSASAVLSELEGRIPLIIDGGRLLRWLGEHHYHDRTGREASPHPDPASGTSHEGRAAGVRSGGEGQAGSQPAGGARHPRLALCSEHSAASF